MQKFLLHNRVRMGWVMAACLMVLAACSPAAPVTPAAETAPAAEATLAVEAVPSQAPTAVPAEPTAAATPTAEPTPEPQPTAVPTEALPALAEASQSLTAWCMGMEFSGAANYAGGVFDMPAGGKAAVMAGDVVNLSVPAVSCTLAFQMSQPLTAGTRLELAEMNSATAWLSAELTPAAGSDHQGFVTLTHAYVINPPFWEITYPYRVKGPDGTVLTEGKLRLAKPAPQLCWNGDIPDPVTLQCVKNDPKELEPGDPGYCGGIFECYVGE